MIVDSFVVSGYSVSIKEKDVIYEQYPPDIDLMQFIHKPPFQPVKYKGETGHVLVISDNEFHLNDISAEGTQHAFFYEGRAVVCTFKFNGEGRYGGGIVVYINADGEFLIRPQFEFHSLFKLEN